MSSIIPQNDTRAVAADAARNGAAIPFNPAAVVADAQTNKPSWRSQSGNAESAVGGAYHGAPSTSSVKRPERSVEAQAAYERLNAMMVETYPDLAFVLADPDKFNADMRERFAQQKRLTPESPRAFDVSDWAMPTLGSMLSDVRKKSEELTALKSTLERKSANIFGRWVPGRAKEIAEISTALKFLDELGAELTKRTAPGGSVSYLRLLQLTSAVTSAYGFRGDLELSRSERFFLSIDRILEGHKHISIGEAYERYKTDDYVLFEKGSPVKGFAQAQGEFKDALYDFDELKMIGLPIMRDVGIDILLRLLPFDIFPVGVTLRPISADGFVRPSIDFLLHDIRHSTVIFSGRRAYEREHELTPEASAKLSKMMDVWGVELVEKVLAIKDPELRAAVELLAFNNHHDRGYPLAPSSYLAKKPDHVSRLLYKMLSVSGQPTGFRQHRKMLNEAHTFMREFFMPKLAEEQALWSKA